MPSHTPSLFHLLPLVAVALLNPTVSRAGWVRVLPGSFDHVVASETTAAATRDGQVVMVSENGDRLVRLGRSPDKTDTEMLSVRRESERILDLYEVSEADRDSDVAEELLDAERSLARRRVLRQPAGQPESSPPTVLVAASSETIWVHSERRILRVDSERRTAPWPTAMAHPMHLVALDARAILADSAGAVALSDTGESVRIAEFSRAPEHVAATERGSALAWATGREMWMTSAAGGVRYHALPGAVLDLAFCQDDLVALVDAGVYVLTARGQEGLRGLPMKARRLVCPRGQGVPWLAVGDALQVSFDQGRTWQRQSQPSGGAQILDLAASRSRLWLATTDGLYASTDDVSPRPELATGPVQRRRVGHATASWAGWLPKVSFKAGGVASLDERQVEAFVLAAFPLDATTPAAASATYPLESVQSGSGTEDAQRALPLVVVRDSDSTCLDRARHRAVEIAMSEPERARSYVTRAGRAAWLPELRVVISRRYGRSESLDVGGSSTALSSPLGIDTVNDIRYEARATWDLARLVFSPEELAAQTQALHMAELRREIESTMNRLYFERRELHLDHGKEGGAGLRRQLRGEAIDAELDAMSGGEFIACISGRDVVAR